MTSIYLTLLRCTAASCIAYFQDFAESKQ